MNLNHIDLCVADVLATTDFFEKYFEFTCVSPKNPGLNVLRNAERFTLVISRLKATDPVAYPAQFHIGFHVESRALVNALYTKFQDSPAAPIDPPYEARKAYLFYLKAPGNILIEIATRE